MQKKNHKYLLVLLIFISIFACEKITQTSPKDVLHKYLEAKSNSNYKKAYSYLSKEDKKNKNLNTYKNEMQKELENLKYIYSNKISYDIKNINRKNEKAIVKVDFTIPDFKKMFTKSFGVIIQSNFNGSNENIKQKITNKLENKDINYITKEKKYNLIKENGSWKVFLDWNTQEKIDKLMTEAEELKSKNELDSAADKYKKVLELNSNMVQAKEELNKTNEKIKLFKKKQAYVDNVKLYNFKTKYYNTYTEDNISGVKFKLKNEGNKTLKEVEVTVYFKNKNGTIIDEKKYYPINDYEYSINDEELLKPNYIWQMERDKFYKASSVPSEWQEGSAVAKITNIEFAESNKEKKISKKNFRPKKSKAIVKSEKSIVDDIILRNVRAYMVENEKIGQLLVIEGKAKNNSPTHKTNVKLRIQLFDKNGKVIQEKTFFSGNSLSLFQLQISKRGKIEKKLTQEGSSKQKVIDPQDELKFMSVFFNLSKELSEFSVEVESAQNAK